MELEIRYVMPLTKGFRVTLCEEGLSRVESRRWHASPTDYGTYAARWLSRDSTTGLRAKGSKVYMHRFLMDATAGQQVDHINGDTLDNRLSNLRVCTQSLNNANTGKRIDNTSGYRGVGFHIPSGKWRARCRHNGKVESGIFDTPEEAARAYNKWAKELFGRFAYLNEV